MSHEAARRARVATGRLIKEHRERRQLSQEQLATLVDLSRFTVDALEEGRQTLGLDHGRKLAKALGIPVPIASHQETDPETGDFEIVTNLKRPRP